MASLIALRNDKDLQKKILDIWHKYQLEYQIIRGNYMGQFLDCDNYDEGAQMTKDFGKRSSKLLADSLHKMQQCMATRINNTCLRLMVNELIHQGIAEESESSEDD